LVVGAIGRVHVDEQVRQPGVEQLEPVAYFRCIGLHVVAVEIQILRGGAKAHDLRPVLIDAVVGRGVLVAVDVEDRQIKQDRVVEQAREFSANARTPAPGIRIVKHEIAQQHQARILAFDFAGVDAGLHEQDLFA